MMGQHRFIRAFAAVSLLAGVSVVGTPAPASAAPVEQNGPLNYAGPNCPGAGWNCTTQTTDLIQRTTGGQNVLDAPSGTACQVVQEANGGTNTATCALSSSAAGAALSANIDQTNTTGSNTAEVTLTVSGQTGTAQSATQGVVIDQSNVDGSNTADVTETITQTSSVLVNAPVVQSQSGEIDAAVTQAATGSGSNTATVTQHTTQSQSANGTTVSQTQRVPAVGSNPTPDTDATVEQDANSGNNLATLDQRIDRSQSGTSVVGGTTQVQGTQVGGVRAIIDPDSVSGTSHYDADQTKDWDQDSSALGTVSQTQYDPQDCCIILGGLYTPDTCTIEQTANLDQDTSGIQEVHARAQAVAHDSCTANQSATIDGNTHTHSASGPFIDTATNCTPNCQSSNRPISRVGAEVKNGTASTYGTSATATHGDSVDYRFTYSNDGVVTGTGTTVATEIPTGTTFTSCTASCSVSGSAVTWNLGTVAAGASVPVGLTVQVAAGAPAGTVSTTATGDTAEETEAPVTSNAVTLTIEDRPISRVDAAIKNGNASTYGTSATAAPNETVDYRFTYSNDGPVAGTGTTVASSIPAGTTFTSCTASCSVSGSAVTWNLGTVGAGTSVPVVLTVQVNSNASAGSVSTTATGDTAEESEAPAVSNSVTLVIDTTPRGPTYEAVRNVTTGQVFTGDATPSSTNASPNQIIEYRVTYRPPTGMSATPIEIHAPVPAQTTYVGCHGCTSGSPENGVVIFNNGNGDDLGGRVATFKVRVNANATGEIEHVSTVYRKDVPSTPPAPSNRTTVRVG